MQGCALGPAARSPPAPASLVYRVRVEWATCQRWPELLLPGAPSQHMSHSLPCPSHAHPVWEGCALRHRGPLLLCYQGLQLVAYACTQTCLSRGNVCSDFLARSRMTPYPCTTAGWRFSGSMCQRWSEAKPGAATNLPPGHHLQSCRQHWWLQAKQPRTTWATLPSPLAVMLFV